ncbi:hypothetical protein SAMN04488056_106139 [Cohaesibacter marisflavi]|uniref:Uncharacterized protein n=1 Tax=Cohaesibacter marisflavi TaxID=655353 RepID=A0A1I5HC36_9HYPH|nr:hypothetical protein [Cohaesibacter marisflavi]SFO45556.1 hypothetical protein SAMN04488056_106139 [Cohaesibacter marisflavi]
MSKLSNVHVTIDSRTMWGISIGSFSCLLVVLYVGYLIGWFDTFCTGTSDKSDLPAATCLREWASALSGWIAAIVALITLSWLKLQARIPEFKDERQEINEILSSIRTGQKAVKELDFRPEFGGFFADTAKLNLLERTEKHFKEVQSKFLETKPPKRSDIWNDLKSEIEELALTKLRELEEKANIANRASFEEAEKVAESFLRLFEKLIEDKASELKNRKLEIEEAIQRYRMK